MVAFNTTTGFWLIHSVPIYPPAKQSGYSWPSNAYDYGQTFLCVTYNIDMLDVIGKSGVKNSLGQKFNAY